MTTTLRDGTLFLLSSLNYRSKRESQKKKKPVLSSHRPRTLGEEKESSTDPRKRRADDERCLLSSSSSSEEKMKKPTSSRFFFCLFLLFSASSKLNRKRARRENQSIEKKTPALSLEIPLTETAPRERNKREIFKSALVNISICFISLPFLQISLLLSSSRVCCPPGPRAFRFRSLSLSKIFMRRRESFSSSVPAAFLFFVQRIHLHPK